MHLRQADFISQFQDRFATEQFVEDTNQWVQDEIGRLGRPSRIQGSSGRNQEQGSRAAPAPAVPDPDAQGPAPPLVEAEGQAKDAEEGTNSDGSSTEDDDADAEANVEGQDSDEGAAADPTLEPASPPIPDPPLVESTNATVSATPGTASPLGRPLGSPYRTQTTPSSVADPGQDELDEDFLVQFSRTVRKYSKKRDRPKYPCLIVA